MTQISNCHRCRSGIYKSRFLIAKKRMEAKATAATVKLDQETVRKAACQPARMRSARNASSVTTGTILSVVAHVAGRTEDCVRYYAHVVFLHSVA